MRLFGLVSSNDSLYYIRERRLSPTLNEAALSVRYAAGELAEADIGYDLQSLSRSNALGNGESLYQSRSMISSKSMGVGGEDLKKGTKDIRFQMEFTVPPGKP